MSVRLTGRLLMALLGSIVIESCGGGDASGPPVDQVGNVTVSAPANQLIVGTTMTLTATVTSTTGAVLTGRTIDWASSNSSVATVSGGVVTAVAAGSVTIMASTGGKTGQVGLTVNIDNTVASVVVTAPSTQVTKGSTLQLTATTKNAAGDVLTGHTVAWSTADAALATVSTTGLVQGITPGGPIAITATSEGKSGVLNVVVVQDTTVASVRLSAPVVQTDVGQPVQMVAIALNPQGDTLQKTFTWTTSNPTVATVSAFGLVSPLSEGVVKIKATLGSKADSVTLTVVDYVESVTLSAPKTQLREGESMQVTATLKNGRGDVLTGSHLITWTSSNDNIATVSQAGMVSAISRGSVTISAISEGKTGFLILEVLDTVAIVNVSAPSTEVGVGSVLQLSASVLNADSEPLIGRQVTWSSSNTAFATVNSTGLVTGVAPGSVTITANSEGHSGSVNLTVIALGLCVAGTTAPGQTVAGQLQSGDCLQPDTTYQDKWRIRITETVGLRIDLISSDFKPFLIVEDSTQTPIAFGINGTDSHDQRLERTFAPGVYYIVANTVDSGETGAYTLSVVKSVTTGLAQIGTLRPSTTDFLKTLQAEKKARKRTP